MNLDDVPALPGGGLLGHLTMIRDDTLGLLKATSHERGDIARVLMPGRDIGWALSPAAIHEILVTKAKSFEKSPLIRISLEPLAGQGLFTSEGDLWRRQRKLMSPLFLPKELERYATCMREVAERSASSLCEGAVLDMSRETTRITMAIAARALFDADTFGEADDIGDAITVALDWANWISSTFTAIVQAQTRTALVRLRDELGGPLHDAADKVVRALDKPIAIPNAKTRRMRDAVSFLDDRVARMIADRRAAGLDRDDLLTALLKSRDEDDGSHMSDKQVRDEILTLFIAGHETTATALAWSLYLLARHDDVRRAVVAEVDALAGGPVTHADLPKLSLCLAVFKEALRIYPPIFIIGRQAIADVEVTGCHLRKGTVMLVSPYAVHHRADVWPDPERFDPSRFTPEREAERPRGAYIPFSLGPRTCIGNHFALMEGPIVLATLLQRASFSLTSSDVIEPEPSATLRPKGGMPMRVTLRAPPSPTDRAA